MRALLTLESGHSPFSVPSDTYCAQRKDYNNGNIYISSVCLWFVGALMDYFPIQQMYMYLYRPFGCSSKCLAATTEKAVKSQHLYKNTKMQKLFI